METFDYRFIDSKALLIDNVIQACTEDQRTVDYGTRSVQGLGAVGRLSVSCVERRVVAHGALSCFVLIRDWQTLLHEFLHFFLTMIKVLKLLADGRFIYEFVVEKI